MGAIRSQSRESRNPERGRQIEVRFLDTNKENEMRQNKVLQFSASGYETPSIPLKNPEGVKKRKRKQEVKRNSHEHKTVVRVQSEKIQSGRKKDKRFESEGGVRVLH